MKDSQGNNVKVDAIHRFRLTRGTEVEIIDFIPVHDVPGYTHRVAFNNVLTARHLGIEFKPNVKCAIQMSDLITGRLK